MSAKKEATDQELLEVTQIGKRFRSFLVHCNLTFAQAATELGVSPSMISRLSEGVNMTVDLIERILVVFPDLNGHWLLTGMGSMEQSALERASKDYLTGDATETEKLGLQEMRKQYETVPSWQHGAITEEAMKILQAFLDEAMYLDRIGLLIQRRAAEFLKFHRNLPNES